MSMTDNHAPMADKNPASFGKAVLAGGIIAGVLDAVDGVIFNYLANGLNPVQVLQYIASGFFGARSFQLGLASAATGTLAHFFIAFVLAAIYTAATKILSFLNSAPWLFGALFGAAVFLVMNFIVLPQTNVVPVAMTPAWFINGLIGHALFVGVPIALMARRTR